MSTNKELTKKGLRSSYFSTIIGIALVLFMIGLVLAGFLGLESLQRQAKENLQGDLFFTVEWNESDIKQVEQSLKSWDCFSEVTYISPERAIDDFSGSDENSAEIVAIFEGDNPLPSTISFKPKAQFATKSGMKTIKKRLLNAYPTMIDEVNYDENSVEDVNLGFKQFAFLFLTVALLLIFVAVAMINNTIRLALYSKRFTIKTMQLVGATGKFIRKPFLMQALFQGLVAGIIGMALLMTLFFALNNVLDIVQIDLSLFDISLLFMTIIAIGCLLTFISTWFALTKYLRMKLDDLY